MYTSKSPFLAVATVGEIVGAEVCSGSTYEAVALWRDHQFAIIILFMTQLHSNIRKLDN